MGAAYRSPKPKDLRKVIAMIREVKALGLETCATLGMLTAEQAVELKDAGLDYYNHNLDTSAGYYEKIITTRTYQDRLDTLKAVRDAGMNVCCGGIVGMGEAPQDRAGLLQIRWPRCLSHPDSVPINQLVRVAGTPLSNTRGPRSLRFRAHHRRRAHSHAARTCAAVCRPQRHERRIAGPVLHGGSELHILRGEAAHHGQSRHGARPRSVRAAENRRRAAADRRLRHPGAPPPDGSSPAGPRATWRLRALLPATA